MLISGGSTFIGLFLLFFIFGETIRMRQKKLNNEYDEE